MEPLDLHTAMEVVRCWLTTLGLSADQDRTEQIARRLTRVSGECAAQTCMMVDRAVGGLEQARRGDACLAADVLSAFASNGRAHSIYQHWVCRRLASVGASDEDTRAGACERESITLSGAGPRLPRAQLAPQAPVDSIVQGPRAAPSAAGHSCTGGSCKSVTRDVHASKEESEAMTSSNSSNDDGHASQISNEEDCGLRVSQSATQNAGHDDIIEMNCLTQDPHVLDVQSWLAQVSPLYELSSFSTTLPAILDADTQSVSPSSVLHPVDASGPAALHAPLWTQRKRVCLA